MMYVLLWLWSQGEKGDINTEILAIVQMEERLILDNVEIGEPRQPIVVFSDTRNKYKNNEKFGNRSTFDICFISNRGSIAV